MTDRPQAGASRNALGVTIGGLVVVVAVVALVLRGRAPSEPAAAAPEQTRVQIVSEPAGATVSRVDDGRALGVTPFELTMPKSNQELPVFVRLAGYQEHRVTVPLFSATGRIDVELFANGVDAAPRAKAPPGEPIP